MKTIMKDQPACAGQNEKADRQKNKYLRHDQTRVRNAHSFHFNFLLNNIIKHQMVQVFNMNEKKETVLTVNKFRAERQTNYHINDRFHFR